MIGWLRRLKAGKEGLSLREKVLFDLEFDWLMHNNMWEKKGNMIVLDKDKEYKTEWEY